MRALVCLLLAWSMIPAQTSAAPVDQPLGSPLRDRDAAADTASFLPPPSQDPWWQPPAGWELTSPGSALKLRPSAYPSIYIANCIGTFQVLYRTSDSHRNATWAVATVFIPASHAGCKATNPEACAHGIVSYQVPYDSADPDAGPSYLLQFGEPYGEMRDLLARGWFVLVPDYEGPLASYCAGVQAGHATLDAVRAVLQVAGLFGLQTSRARAAIWGYSGGALAAGFAAELAATYAPDLELAGIVFGGTAPNLTTVNQRMNGKDTAGLFVASLLGITTQHPEARKFMISRLKASGPYNATYFLSGYNMSGVEALRGFAYHDVYEYFEGGSADVFSPVMNAVYEKDGNLGFHGVPNMPVFLYKAISDEMSPVKETDDLVEQYCAQGANILYHRNTVGGHNQELWTGRQRTMDYLAAVLDGKKGIWYPATGCAVLNVTIPVNVTAPGTERYEGNASF
jgi:hypothetical protein